MQGEKHIGKISGWEKCKNGYIPSPPPIQSNDQTKGLVPPPPPPPPKSVKK